MLFDAGPEALRRSGFLLAKVPVPTRRMDPERGTFAFVLCDVRDNRVKVRFVANADDMATLGPDGSGERRAHRVGGGLLGATGDRFGVVVFCTDEGVGVTCGDRDDACGVAHLDEFLAQGRCDRRSQFGRKVKRRRRDRLGKLVQGGVFADGRRVLVVARGVDAMVVVAEAARIAGEPGSAGTDGDVRPVGPT